MSQLAFEFSTPEPRMRTEPYRHQLEEYTDHYDDEQRALIWQMRTGKTKVIIDSACRLFLEDKIDTLLVVAPNGVHENWIDKEVPKHMWDNVLYNTWCWDTELKELDLYIQCLHKLCISKKLRIALFSSATLASQILARKFLVKIQTFSKKGMMLVFDEATDFRSPGSKRTKWARAFSKKPIVKYKRLLTGTPLLNSILHGYSQLELLQPKFFDYSTYDAFKNRYADYEVVRGSYPKLMGYKNLDEFKRKLDTVASFLSRDDCPDLTNINYLIQPIKLHSLQKKAIEILVAKAKDKVHNIPTTDLFSMITEIKKCFIKEQQIVSGFIGIKDEFDQIKYTRLVPHKENPKLRMLVEQVRYTEEPIIVWCQFRYDIRLICNLLRAMNITYANYYGETTQVDKRHTRQTFNDGKIKVLVGQPQSAGLGLDLSIASKIIWYSHTYNAIVREQANERATNMTKANIELIDFEAPPIDKAILKALSLKKNISEYIAESDPAELLAEISLV